MKITKRASNGIYMLEYMSTDGIRIRRSTGKRDFKEATQAALDLVGDKNGPITCLYTVADALEDTWHYRWAGQKSGAKKWSEAKKVHAAWGQRSVTEVTYEQLQQWVAVMKCEQNLAPATINKRLSVLGTALREAVKLGHLKNVPTMPRVENPKKKIRFITREEDLLLNRKALDMRPISHANIMCNVMDVLLYTGMRLGELLKAKPEDRFGNILIIYEPKSGKAEESIPLTDGAVNGLEFLWRHDVWQTLTRNARGSPSDLARARDWCIRRFTTIRNAAGLPDVSLHTLRHTTASRLVQAGVDLYKVQKILRHSSPVTTQGYAHLRVEHLMDDINVLDKGTDI